MNTRIPGVLNRAERRRLAKTSAKTNVVPMTPAVAAASERLRRARAEGPKTAYPEKESVDDPKGFEPVDFTIYNSPNQVVVEFERKIKYMVLSPEKARKVAEILIKTADRVEEKLDDDSDEDHVNTSDD